MRLEQDIFKKKMIQPSVEKKVLRGFTLIELLVVVAIISVLAAILFPVFARARESARRTSCLSNQKQIGLGFLQYFQDYDEQFPANKGDTAWPGGGVQPYLKSIQILRCPNDEGAKWEEANRTVTTTSYVLNGFFPASAPSATPSTNPWNQPEVGIKNSHIAAVQSPASVIMLAEAPDKWTGSYFHAFSWDVPGYSDSEFTPNWKWSVENGREPDPSNPYYPNYPGDLETVRHMGGFNATYLDGHSKWIKWEQAYKIDNSYTPPLKGQFDPRSGSGL